MTSDQAVIIIGLLQRIADAVAPLAPGARPSERIWWACAGCETDSACEANNACKLRVSDDDRERGL